MSVRASRNELAALFGVTTKTIDVWTAEGMPRVGGGRGKAVAFDVPACIEWRVESEVGKRSDPGSMTDITRRRRAAAVEMEEARAALLRAKAGERVGELVEKRGVATEVAALARAERDALLLLPARDAPAMAAALGVDEGRLRLALEDMLRAHLERPLPEMR